MSSEDKNKQRLDKWLKTVRLFKTRKIASEACDKRMIKVNDVTSKPSKMVSADDEITIRKGGKYRVFKVLGVSHKSIAAKLARELYEEITPDMLTEEDKELIKMTRELEKKFKPKHTGKPAKKDRRDIMKIKYGDTF